MKERKIILWWGPPNRFSQREEERKVSWLELFYDLVYVATIGQLMHHLSAHLSWNQAGLSLFIFAFIYWSWANGSLYHDLHGNNAIRTRVFTLLQIISIAAVAVTLDDFFKKDHQSFAVAFAILQFIITYLWWSTGQYDPSHKKLNKYYVLNYSLSFIIFITSASLSYNYAIASWSIALVLNLSTSLVSRNTIKSEMDKRHEQFTISSTMTERYGLFAIIALGETIFGIIETISVIPSKNYMVWTEFSLGILISFLLWWIYFGMIGNKKVKIGYRYFILIDYLNLILLFVIAVIGACFRAMITIKGNHFEIEQKWIFCTALAVTLLTIVLLTLIRKHSSEEMHETKATCKMLIVSSLLSILLACFSEHLPVIGFIAAIASILFLTVIVGIQFKTQQEN